MSNPSDKPRTSEVDRRRILKLTGASIGIGSIAGCLGGDSDGDGDGDTTPAGDGDGDGDGQLQQFAMSTPPIGVPYGVISPYLENNNVFAETLEPRGYQVDWQQTFDGPTLFASGNVNVSAMSYFEGARLAQEQNQNIVTFGKVFASNQALFIKAGGPYDPDETGSPQASIDQIVEDNAQVGIASWASGNIPYHQRIIEDVFGYTLAEQGSDVNVITTDFSTMPQLILDDELAAAAYSPTSGGAVELANGQIKGLYWVPNTYQSQGWGLPPLNNLTTRLEFAENNPSALLGVLDLWSNGLGWLHSNLDSLIGNPDVVEQAGATNQEGADYMLRTLIGGEAPLDEPIVYENADIGDSYAQQGTTLLNDAEDKGQIPTGWEESFQFMTRSEIEDLA